MAIWESPEERALRRSEIAEITAEWRADNPALTTIQIRRKWLEIRDDVNRTNDADDPHTVETCSDQVLEIIDELLPIDGAKA